MARSLLEHEESVGVDKTASAQEVEQERRSWRSLKSFFAHAAPQARSGTGAPLGALDRPDAGHRPL